MSHSANISPPWVDSCCLCYHKQLITVISPVLGGLLSYSCCGWDSGEILGPNWDTKLRAIYINPCWTRRHLLLPAEIWCRHLEQQYQLICKLTEASPPPGGVWGRHCGARRYAQSGRRVETQLHHLHCVQVLVLPRPVGHLRHPRRSALGFPVCLHLLLPHLGRGSLHQELPDWVPVHQPHLLPLHPDLLRSLLWSTGQGLRQYTRRTTQRGLNIQKLGFLVWTTKVPDLFIHNKIRPGFLLYSPIPLVLLYSHAAPQIPAFSWYARCAFCNQKLCDSCSRQLSTPNWATSNQTRALSDPETQCLLSRSHLPGIAATMDTAETTPLFLLCVDGCYSLRWICQSHATLPESRCIFIQFLFKMCNVFDNYGVTCRLSGGNNQLKKCGMNETWNWNASVN